MGLFNQKRNRDAREVFENFQGAEAMILGCGGTKEDQHYEKKGKLYGIRSFAHCDTDCPYTEGTCFSRCSRLGWNQRPCLKAAYREKKKS